jgi:tetratricopeptide (TPR) repeat protein
MAVLKHKRGYLKTITLALGLILLTAPMSQGADKMDSLAALYNNLAVAHALNHDYDLAAVYFDSAGMFVDDYPSLDNNRGNYFLCTGHIFEAIDHYRAALETDPPDNNILFNLSIGLYLADSIDASVETMQLFVDYAGQQDSDDTMVTGILDEVMAVKGDAKKVSKAEVRRLIEKAKAKRNKALKKKEDKSKKDSGTVAKAKEKPADTTKKKKQKKTSPAGEKSYEMTGITKLLYWIIL